MRNEYPPKTKEYIVKLHNCIERKWMRDVVFGFFNDSHQIDWYDPRILFQAMDMFDRYITKTKETAKIPPNQLESKEKGLFHTKAETELRFMACVHLCIKYFSTMTIAVPYANLFPEEMQTKKAIKIVENFEGSLIVHCFKYEIYRHTIYEAADEFGDVLTKEDVARLLIFYASNESIANAQMTRIELYKYYRENLKGSEGLDVELLRKPISVS